MKRSKLIYLTFSILIISISIGFAFSKKENTNSNASKNSFEKTQQNNDAFDKMMSVVAHKRCVNCHPSGDRPRQGEDSHLHNFNIQRGASSFGEGSLSCNTCHHEENNDYSGVPGAPHWHLAPKSMGWEGLNKKEIARAMLDKTKNGNRSLADIVKHLTEDELVLWVFEPGKNNEGIPREKPPISKEEFISSVKEWAAAGANIPD